MKRTASVQRMRLRAFGEIEFTTSFSWPKTVFIEPRLTSRPVRCTGPAKETVAKRLKVQRIRDREVPKWKGVSAFEEGRTSKSAPFADALRRQFVSRRRSQFDFVSRREARERLAAFERIPILREHRVRHAPPNRNHIHRCVLRKP